MTCLSWSSCLSHTCSPSNHQRRLKHPGLLSTRFHLVSLFKSPHRSQGAASELRRQAPFHLSQQTNTSVDPPASHSPLPPPPPQPLPPRAVSPSYTACCAARLSLSKPINSFKPFSCLGVRFWVQHATSALCTLRQLRGAQHRKGINHLNTHMLIYLCQDYALL